MANQQKVSGIYGKPKFGLILGLFLATIVVLLVCGWLFLRMDPLKMRGTQSKRTGMVLVLPSLRITR